VVIYHCFIKRVYTLPNQQKEYFMRRLMDFIYYNIFVYVIYWIIDYIFDLLNLYSSHDLGKDILIMPTSSDMTLISINVIASMILGLIALKYIKKIREI